MAETIHEFGSAIRTPRVHRKRRTPQIRSFLLWTFLVIGISLSLPFALAAKDSGNVKHTRKALESSEDTSHPTWREKGLDLLYAFRICYMFLGISIVCDHFLVGSCEAISEKLNLSEDVAGATFKALGSSAPELLASIAALANSHVANEIETGTIVGSVVFNILVIIGLSAMCSESTLTLDYRPLIRDSLFCALSIIGVTAVFYDGKIYWWEGLILVFLYGLYVLAKKFNAMTMNLFPTPRSANIARSDGTGVDLESLPFQRADTVALDEETSYEEEEEENDKKAPLIPATNDETIEMNITIPEQADQDGTANKASVAKYDQCREDDKNLFDVPKSIMERIFWLLSLPWRCLFYLTIPNCSKKCFEKCYMVTFTVSLLYVGAISWLMVEWADDLDCLLGISAEFVGEIAVATGISVRTALAAIRMARAGNGNQTVVNVPGSIVFDVLLGLGLPWVLVTPIIGETSSYGTCIKVSNSEVLPIAVILFVLLCLYASVVFYARRVLKKCHGQFFMTLYLTYVLCRIIAVWAS